MADKMAKQKSFDSEKRKHAHRHVTHDKTFARSIFHKDESKQYHLPGYGQVYWQLNLKDDEVDSESDAFIYDEMLDYVEQHEHTHPFLRTLLEMNEKETKAANY